MDAELSLSLAEDGASVEELETAGGSLREELLALDVASVRAMPAGPAPDGTRGLDAATFGAMLVSLPATPPVLAAVVDVMRRWIGRSDGDRSVRIEIAGDSLELSRVSDEEQTLLIEDWLKRRTAETAATPAATPAGGSDEGGGTGGGHA